MEAARAHPQTEGEPLATALRPRGPVHLDLTQETRSSHTVIRARGELDVLTAGQLARSLDSALRGPEQDVVVDLSETEFLDSTGLRVLLNAQRRLAGRSRKLTVLCGQGPVRRVIELTRLAETLNLTEPGPAPQAAA